MTESSATSVWHGSLREGRGRTSFGTGALPEVAATWTARAGTPDDGTTPEELLAAAHATCYGMALAGGLSRTGHPPEELRVRATCTFDPTAIGITSMVLVVDGAVPGIDTAGFQAAASAAKDGCPVSKALAGNVEITLRATLR